MSAPPPRPRCLRLAVALLSRTQRPHVLEVGGGPGAPWSHWKASSHLVVALVRGNPAASGAGRVRSRVHAAWAPYGRRPGVLYLVGVVVLVVRDNLALLE